ncbi:hypothetical protein LJR153_006604 [Paenibacillus sp. LjRoot153]
MQLTDSSATDSLVPAKLQPILQRKWTSRYENYVDFHDLQLTLTRIKSADIRSQMKLYSLVSGWAMDSAGFFEPTAQDEGLKKLMLGKMVNSNLNTIWTGDASSFYYARRIPFYSSDPEAVFIMAISLSDLSRIVGESHQLGSLVILDNSNQTVFSQLDEVWRDNEFSHIIAGKLQETDESNGYFTTELNGRQTEVVFTKSTYNNWTYPGLDLVGNIHQFLSCTVL